MLQTPDRPAPTEAVRDEGIAQGPVPRRLSMRLVWVTMIAILVAEVLIFVPSLAHFQVEWLHSKIETAAVASFVAGQGNGAGDPMLTPEREAELLRALGAQLIAVEAGGASRLIARASEIGPITREVDLAVGTLPTRVTEAFGTLLLGGGDTVRASGPIGDHSMVAEVVLEDRALREDMLAYARGILVVSLIIAAFAGLLLSLTINRVLLGPVRAMTRSMVSFRERPEDPDRIIVPIARDDELGFATQELARMQTQLAQTLRERRHLADLGLAVSKINHDLRNTLASAQLISDRFSAIPDPEVQRFAPTLIRSLDRALAYTRSVLAYGRAVEEAPAKRKLRLAVMVDEILETVVTQPDPRVELVNAVPVSLEVDVDPGQFERALGNLVRNAVEAVQSDPSEALVRRVRVDASGPEDGRVQVTVEDTGPGLSEQARRGLFQAFRGSTRSGGTGLGLAIAAEIVEAHGGRIRLDDRPPPGARFVIELPWRRQNGQG